MEQITRVFPARFSEIVQISALVEEAAAAAGFDEQGQFHLQLACDEACTNIIQHAYGGDDLGTIDLALAWQPGRLIIQLRDTGRSFTPPEPAKPDRSGAGVNLDTLEEGGWGLHFIRTIMDEVHFNFDPIYGNTLTMAKDTS